MNEETVEVLEEIKGDTEEVKPEEESKAGTEPDAENDSEEEAAKDEKEDEEKKPKFKKGYRVQKRINKLTREKRELEAEVERLRYELQKREIEASRPKFEDFETDAEYLEALAEYKVREKLLSEPKPMTAEAEIDSDFASRSLELLEKGEQLHSDFREKVTASDYMTKEVVEAVMKFGDNAPELLYELANNPDILEDISQSDDEFYVVRQLAHLEGRLGNKSKVTQAPPPVKAVNANDSGTIDPDKMSMEQWMQWRNKQLGRE